MRNPTDVTAKDIAHLGYMLLKDAGICTACRAAWAAKGHVHCKACRAYFKEYRIDHATRKAQRKPSKWAGRN